MPELLFIRPHDNCHLLSFINKPAERKFVSASVFRDKKYIQLMYHDALIRSNENMDIYEFRKHFGIAFKKDLLILELNSYLINKHIDAFNENLGSFLLEAGDKKEQVEYMKNRIEFDIDRLFCDIEFIR